MYLPLEIVKQDKCPKYSGSINTLSSNLLSQAKYCVRTCFQYTLVQLSFVDMLRSYHASLCVDLYYLYLFFRKRLKSYKINWRTSLIFGKSILERYVVYIQSNLSIRSPLLSIRCIERSRFTCPVIENFIWIEPFLRGHLSYKTTFSLSQRWPLNTGLTVL